jgi:hypothetical protein
MLPSNPRIQPVKGGQARDRITSGWGNGIISELHLPSESAAFSHQMTGPISGDAENTIFFDVFGKVSSSFGPDEWFACGHIFDAESSIPNIHIISCDQMFSYLVTDEQLTTDDRRFYQSVHGTSGNSNSDWLRDPQPVVTVNGQLKVEDEDYSVDYKNGRIDFGASIKGSTLLTQQANQGATILNVSSTAGFEAGDCIVVKGSQTLQDEVCSVASVPNSTTLYINENLAFSHSSGLAVIENEPVVNATYRYIEQHQSRLDLNPTSQSYQSGLVAGVIESAEKTSGTYGILRLKNPAFLNWETESLPDSWQTEGAGIASISQTSDSLFGDLAVMVESTANSGWKCLKQTIDCSSHGDVRLSCWVKASNRSKIEIIPSDGPGGYTILDVSPGQPMEQFANKWVRLSVICIGQPPYTVKLYAQGSQNDGGTAKFDGVCLVEV